ncbi:hypothetical protein L0Z72_10070 [candidate division KSB1 bacterium]|nr:hypothetical protein [candidate division KSB1 bacterium]
MEEYGFTNLYSLRVENVTLFSHCGDPSADGDEAEGAPLACNLVVPKGLLLRQLADRNDIFEPCYMINLNESIKRKRRDIISPFYEKVHTSKEQKT